MQCAWDAYLSLLPGWMRAGVDRQGRDSLQELRLRINSPPELNTATGSFWLPGRVSNPDIQFCINAASRYSPWAAQTMQEGYITAPGGHRMGVCGDAITSDGVMTGIRTAAMLCIRVARDFLGLAEDIPLSSGSVLIIGPPGSGKTTLLRDLIRKYSNTSGQSISVVDERGELFPFINGQPCYPTGKRTDIMSGCKKASGISAVLRCMGPSVIAVDEITAVEDCHALIQAGWCGVHLFATAHAASMEDLYTRPVYKPILQTNLFDTLIVLRSDKSWHMERMDK